MAGGRNLTFFLENVVIKSSLFFIYIRILFMYAVLRNTFTEGGELGNQFKYIGLTGAVN